MNKYRISITAILVISSLVYAAGAYPPDNAALLYYRAFALMDSTSNMFMFNPPQALGGFSAKVDNNGYYIGHSQGTVVVGDKTQAFRGCKIPPDIIKCCSKQDINDCNLKGCVASPSGCEVMKGGCRKINPEDANFLRNAHIDSGTDIIICPNAPDVNSGACPHGVKVISKGNTIVSKSDRFSMAFAGSYGGIVKYAKGTGEPNEQLKRYIEYNPAVDIAIAASKIENCDWGIDPCNFTREFMPHLGGMRKLAYLLIADSKIAAAEGDYDTALERCLAVKRMAHHQTPTKFKMEGLVNITLEKMANERIKKLLIAIDGNAVKLNWLKNEIYAIDSRAPLSLKDCIAYEQEMFGSCGDSGDIHIVKMAMIIDSDTMKAVKDTGKQCFAVTYTDRDGKSYKIDGNEQGVNAESASADYKVMTEKAISLWEKPYKEAYEGFKKLAQDGPQMAFCNTDGSGKNKVVAKMTMVDFGFSYTEDIMNQTLNNAIKTAIEVYLVKARTGQLPQTLPSGTPKDLFSGQDFDYEKAQDGFILRCRGKDLEKNKIQEFGFKVKS